MESNRNPFIIEFNGLPGSGKTTVSKLLAEKIEKTGISVGRTGDGFKSYKGGKVRKLLRIIKTLDIVILWHLFSFFCSVKPVKLNRLKHIKNIYLYFVAYKELNGFKNDSDIIVVDQGIVQAVVSVVYLDNLENTKQLKKLLHYTMSKGFGYICINCISDNKVSTQRVVERRLNQGRFDKMGYIELLKNQEIQSKTFFKVRQIMSDLGTTSQFQIDMNKSPEENCDILYDSIFKFTDLLFESNKVLGVSHVKNVEKNI